MRNSWGFGIEEPAKGRSARRRGQYQRDHIRNVYHRFQTDALTGIVRAALTMRILSMSIGDFTDLAGRLADTARGIILEGRNRLAMEIKSDGSPVTVIDKAVEAAVREILTKEVPEHGVLGEEFGSVGLDREFVWVIDPIDGTKHFAAALPTFGVLVALCQNKKPALGIIEQPLIDERTVGLAAGGCWFNGQPVTTSGRDSLAETVGALAGPDDYRVTHTPGFERLRGTTRWNLFDTGCLGYASLARGAIDLCLNGPNLDAFDICALVPVVEGAGGRITGWDGAAVTLESEGAILGTASAALHDAALARLNDV
jgi:inositol-phosphate phosphatase / L-galactose 1-phosphate phosphatase / histidinol-phosphatase